MTDTPNNENVYLPDISLKEIMEILPHRYPMLMIDKIVEVTQDNGAVAIKNVTFNEEFFQGHFPSTPVMPGVLIIEAMAQAAAAYTAKVENLDTKDKIVLFMGVEKAKFRRPVVPGDQLRIHVEVEKRRPPVWKFSGRAEVDGKVVTEAQFSAMLTAPS